MKPYTGRQTTTTFTKSLQTTMPRPASRSRSVATASIIRSQPTCCKMLSTSSHRLFDYRALLAHTSYARVATGRFGAGMQLRLVNDGPVTFWLQV